MTWDWEKLQQRRQRPVGPAPNLGDFTERVKDWSQLRPPAIRWIVGAVVLLWLASGIYIVEPDEVGVVQRFGAYHRTTQPGPHYHFPFPIEKVQTPKVTKIQRVEIGFRGSTAFVTQGGAQIRLVPEESLMLTGDENIVDVQFIVQYQIADAEKFLFRIANPEKTVKDAAEAAMREVIGYNKIDAALTDGKLAIQNEARALMQRILDTYESGIRVVAVQLQDVHPPKQVIDAFKDVASAKEDKSRFINEAEAYENDLLPRTRGEAARIINEAEAYRETVIRKAEGEAARFTSVLAQYRKAEDVTRRRLLIETMEAVFGSDGVHKTIVDPEAMGRTLPLLPLS
ncbi:MAG TPA: FtsH protease activity modulator HflK, partial [Desulfomicrobiaceae bacterium]|nr:FtsH protease activity modulator HflK [Desulfomicrobiaceae bacterium]